MLEFTPDVQKINRLQSNFRRFAANKILLILRCLRRGSSFGEDLEFGIFSDWIRESMFICAFICHLFVQYPRNRSFRAISSHKHVTIYTVHQASVLLLRLVIAHKRMSLSNISAYTPDRFNRTGLFIIETG